MTIKNLYIVAGSRSCGKSIFITWYQEKNNARKLTADLTPLANFEEPIYFMELDKVAGNHLGLLVHVDIFSPFASVLASKKDELLAALSTEAFAQYPNSQLLSQAKNIYILTLYIPRIEILKRWLNRCIAQESPLVRTTLTQIYSDVYGDEPYNQLYKAWDGFVQTLPYKKAWSIVEQGKGSYSLLEWSPAS